MMICRDVVQGKGPNLKEQCHGIPTSVSKPTLN